MATTTYVPLINYTLNSNASTVTLGTGGQGTIPSTYTDLVLVAQVKTVTYNGVDINVRVGNGSIDAGANYSTTAMYGNGSSASTSATTGATYFSVDGMSIMNTSEWTITTLHFQNYANTNVNKPVIARTSKAGTGVSASVNLWRSTSAIDTIRFLCGADNYASGSTFTLYGIVNADTGALATGGVITYDSTYYSHTFGSSGTFTPKQALSNADYLVVAGGGGAGYGGGGGGGGLLSTIDNYGGPSGSLQTKLSFASGTAYAITIGAGGSGTTNYTNGSAGGDSSIIGGSVSVTSTGGGRGGGTSPSTGGSGGAYGYNQTGNGAAGTSTQGYAGGNAQANTAGGGGGGAGAVGANGVNGSYAGNGGVGVAIPTLSQVTGTGQYVNSSWYYAGGGGGAYNGNANVNQGSGGYGGGGTGGTNGSAGQKGGTDGTYNTGGGGGACNMNAPIAGSGGSGIVIIRYPKA